MWVVRRIVGIAVCLGAVLLGCAPPPAAERTAAPGPGAAPASAPRSEVQRTLVLIGGRAPTALVSRPIRETGGAGNPRATYRSLNAGLVINDEREIPHPYLAEAVPELNSDTWRVFPDGRMESVYRLRPNLTWHDGRPLTAEDFAFAHRVYLAPEFGMGGLPPLAYMEEVAAPDPRTVLVRWRQPYALANAVQMTEFPPLPRHLLEASFVPGQPDAFLALPFWTSEYVGAGPYRLARFELGAFLEATAFEGHALGRARIDQVRFIYIPDANTVLANLLSDNAHVALDSSVDLQQAAILDREWRSASTGLPGVVLRNPTGVRQANFQLRPELSTPRTLQDIRVRKALAYATDRQALADVSTDGLSTPADTLVLKELDYYAALDRVITKYPYDPRRAEQLLNEAGYTKGGDGIFASPTEGRFALDVAVAQGGRNETEVAVMADGLRRFGLDTSIRVISRAQVAEPFVLASFPGILVGSHNPATEPPTQRLRAAELATAETRGRGANFSGWTHPEVERLINAYETALDRNERSQAVIQMLKLVSEEVPIYALYYNLEFMAHAGALKGPRASVSNNAVTWNLHEWYWER